MMPSLAGIASPGEPDPAMKLPMSLSRLSLLLAVLALSACATQPPSSRGPVETREAAPAAAGPAMPAPPSGAGDTRGRGDTSAPLSLPPVSASPAGTLLASVDEAIAAGRLEQAAALCERALRISPRDAYLWYRLAAIRFQQERHADAAGFARRALSHAGSDTRLRQAITELLHLAEAQSASTS